MKHSDEFDPYRVEIRVKNNLILRRIEKAGYASIKDFCRKNNIALTDVYTIVSFKKLPLKEDGDWRDSVYDISSALHCEPEDLFTEKQKSLVAKRSLYVSEISEGKLMQLPTAGEEQAIIAKDTIIKLIPVLDARERDVIQKLYVDGASQTQIAEEYNRSKTIVAMLEARALRKLRKEAERIKREDAFNRGLYSE